MFFTSKIKPVKVLFGQGIVKRSSGQIAWIFPSYYPKKTGPRNSDRTYGESLIWMPRISFGYLSKFKPMFLTNEHELMDYNNFNSLAINTHRTERIKLC